MSTLKIAKATKGHASSSQLYQNKEKFVKRTTQTKENVT